MAESPPKFADMAAVPNNDDVDAARFVRDNIGWMLGLAESLVRDRALAEDAVQDAFISAFNGLSEFEERSSLKTWLRRITINAALTKRRQVTRRAEQPIDELLPEFDRLDCRLEARWDHLIPLHEVLESDEICEQVNSAISALPEAYCNVLLLRDVEGYDTREVAVLLDITEANVKVRLHRARAALKRLLEPVLRGEVDT